MNSSINATTGRTPTELLYRTPLRLFPYSVDSTSNLPSVKEFINKSIAIAQDTHIIAKTRQATQANKYRRGEPKYKIGDKVYLSTKHLRLKIKRTGHTTKFHNRYVGPFSIVLTTPETSAYNLEFPNNYKIHPTFYARLLKPFVDNNPELFPARESPRPGPAYDDTDDEFEIEKRYTSRPTAVPCTLARILII
jgi:hypothetical protein